MTWVPDEKEKRKTLGFPQYAGQRFPAPTARDKRILLEREHERILTVHNVAKQTLQNLIDYGKMKEEGYVDVQKSATASEDAIKARILWILRKGEGRV